MSRDLFGALNESIEIFRLRESVDANGSIMYKKKERACTVWASVEVLNTSYWYNYGKRNNLVAYKVVVRRMDDLQVGCYIDFRGKVLEVQNVSEKPGNAPIVEMVAVERSQG